MKKHTKIYFKKLNIDFDTVSGWHNCISEMSGMPSQDIHHIVDRQDTIENLMALTRTEHIKYGDKKKYMHLLLTKHFNYLIVKGVYFDRKYLNGLIKFYENIN